jgi:hypothetical protein
MYQICIEPMATESKQFKHGFSCVIHHNGVYSETIFLSGRKSREVKKRMHAILKREGKY